MKPPAKPSASSAGTKGEERSHRAASPKMRSAKAYSSAHGLHLHHRQQQGGDDGEHEQHCPAAPIDGRQQPLPVRARRLGPAGSRERGESHRGAPMLHAPQHDEQEGVAREEGEEHHGRDAEDVGHARQRWALRAQFDAQHQGGQDHDERRCRHRAPCARTRPPRPLPAAGRSSGPERRSIQPGPLPARRNRRPRRARTTDRAVA